MSKEHSIQCRETEQAIISASYTALVVFIFTYMCLTLSFQKAECREYSIWRNKKGWMEEVEFQLDLRGWVGFQGEKMGLGRRSS